MKVISDQEIRVATLSGAVVLFEPGVEREVSDEIGILAMQLGAKQVGVAPVVATKVIHDVPEIEENEPVLTLDDAVSGIEKLVELGDPEDFKADGAPKAAALNRVVGRTVSTEEREAAWDAFLKS